MEFENERDAFSAQYRNRCNLILLIRRVNRVYSSRNGNADVIISSIEGLSLLESTSFVFHFAYFNKAHFMEHCCAINNLFTKVSFFCSDFDMPIFWCLYAAYNTQDSRKIHSHTHTKSFNSLNRAEYRSSAC